MRETWLGRCPIPGGARGQLAECDLVAQAQLIPDLIRATELLALRDDSPDAHRRSDAVAHGAVSFLPNLGELDLAVIPAERMRAAAQTI